MIRTQRSSRQTSILSGSPTPSAAISTKHHGIDSGQGADAISAAAQGQQRSHGRRTHEPTKSHPAKLTMSFPGAAVVMPFVLILG